MNEIEILTGIEPYNDLFYVSCYYNSLIPIIKFYKKDINFIFCNDVNIYCRNSESDIIILDTEIRSVVEHMELLEKNGLGVKTFDQVEGVIENIKKAISNGHPVITWIDCFYESLREDKYGKEHFLHSLLVIGYDDTKQEFLMIEHQREDQLTYSLERIKYKELENVCSGYVNHFKEMWKEPVALEYYLLDEAETAEKKNFCEIYQNSFQKFSSDYEKGNLVLEEYIAFLPTLLEQGLLEKNIGEITNGLSNIINAKKVQLHILEDVVGKQSEASMLLEKIFDNWSVIRAEYVRAMYTGIYDPKKFEDVIDGLKAIKEQEDTLCSVIMTLK